jgi:hypothetical protein
LAGVEQQSEAQQLAYAAVIEAFAGGGLEAEVIEQLLQQAAGDRRLEGSFEMHLTFGTDPVTITPAITTRITASLPRLILRLEPELPMASRWAEHYYWSCGWPRQNTQVALMFGPSLSRSEANDVRTSVVKSGEQQSEQSVQSGVLKSREYVQFEWQEWERIVVCHGE